MKTFRRACAPFRSAAVITLMLMNLASTSSSTTMMSFAVVIATENIGTSSAQAAALMGLGSLIQFLGQFAGATVEAQSLRSNVALLLNRRLQMAVGGVGRSISMLLFSTARTMRAATAWNCLYWCILPLRMQLSSLLVGLGGE